MADDPPTADVEELYSSWALFILTALLMGSLLVSYYLQIKKIKTVHETVVSIFAGMFVGLIIRVSPGLIIQDMVTFKHSYFFNLLLPPIILNSGYELKQANFFRNIGVILTFAFAGTFISAVVLGTLVYLWSLLGIEGLQPTFLEAMIFGSTLSATDPVTILAIFNSYKVDPQLYTIIFGESILNDAVAIVMYETLSQFHGEVLTFRTMFVGIGTFFMVFTVSLLIGVIVGLLCSLLLKYSKMSEFPAIESSFVTLTAFGSYFFSNGCAMSGIVSLLFCGITLKHYAYYNMSRRTQRTTRYLFQILAQLSENFIFIYLGVSLFTQTELVYKPIFILITTLAICVARYAAVMPISKVVNLIHQRRRGNSQSEALPQSYQMMLFWAGLRGAVGVALAAGFEGPNKTALRTTVLVVVVLTVIVFGGTTSRMLEIMNIRTGVVEDDDSNSEDEDNVGRNIYDKYDEDEPSVLHRSASWNNLADSNRRSDIKSPSSQFLNPQDAQFPPRRNTEESDNDSDGSDLPPPATSSHFRSLSRHTTSGVSRDTSPVGRASMTISRALLSVKETVEHPQEWFTSFDERYLMPMFSNSTASRRHSRWKHDERRKQWNRRRLGNKRRDSNDEYDLTQSPVAGSADEYDDFQGGSSSNNKLGLGLISSSTERPLPASRRNSLRIDTVTGSSGGENVQSGTYRSPAGIGGQSRLVEYDDR